MTGSFVRTALVLTALWAATPAALAEGSGKDGAAKVRLSAPGSVAAKVFPAFDANGDDRIDQREFDRQLDRVFRGWDADGDRYLLPGDLPTPALKSVADSNSDSLVTYAEYLPQMLRLRDAMDSNGDRAVTAQEWRAYVMSQRIMPEGEGKGGRR